MVTQSDDQSSPGIPQEVSRQNQRFTSSFPRVFRTVSTDLPSAHVRVLTLAQEEAQRFNHNYMGTEHLLLGLVREGEGVAAKVLSNLGIELTKVRSAVESSPRPRRTAASQVKLA